MGTDPLAPTHQEKDLGVLEGPNLKPSAQVTGVAASAISLLGRIKSTFTCLDEEMLPLLYKSLLRFHMKFAIEAWSPYTGRNIDRLERVQRATKLVPKLPFEDSEW